MPPTADMSPSSETILIVTVDRLPAWVLPAWGAVWVAAPALDALAAQGVVFDRLLTPALDPRMTARDLLGRGPASLLAAVVAGGGRAAVISDQQAIVDAVEPPASVAVTIVEPVLPATVATEENDTNLRRLFDVAAKVVADQRSGLVWVHAGSLGIAWDAPDELRDAYLDPDDPPPPPDSSVPSMPVAADTDPDLLVALRHVFAAQVTLLDRCLGTLVAAQKKRGLLCVVGLRGLPLGLHDWIGGGSDGPEPQLPYSELIHVPAIVVDPAGRMAGQRYGGLATTADLGVTLRELAGVTAHEMAVDERSPGHSLASLLVNWRAPLREQVTVRGAAGDALVTPAWHCIVAHAGAEARLFAKPDDFFEQANVADRCRDVATALVAMLAEK